MEWFIAVVAVAALGLAAMAAAGGGGEMNADPGHDTYAQDLPEQPLEADQVRDLRFGVAFRGYAMDQVDAVLARLAREIADRDARIVELTRGGDAELTRGGYAELTRGGYAEPSRVESEPPTVETSEGIRW